MSICYAVTPGGWKGLRRTTFASLTTAPPTIYFVPLTAELVSCGPLPLPVSGGGHASTIPSILPVAFSQFHSRIAILPVTSHDCILSALFSHYRPPGYFLLRPSSDTILPPPASCRYLPSTLPSQHATSHHFAMVLFNIHTLFSYMLMQPETLKSQTHF